MRCGSCWQRRPRRQTATRKGKLGMYAASGGLLVLGLFMAAGVLDVYRTNRVYIRSQAVFAPAYDAMRWLRQYDLSDYTVRLEPNNVFQDAVISSGLRFIEVWYHFTDIRRLDGSEDTRLVQARPRYTVVIQQRRRSAMPPAPAWYTRPPISTSTCCRRACLTPSLPRRRPWRRKQARASWCAAR